MESLGVRLPDDYRSFMQSYGQKLAEDPISQASWVQGLGNSFFVVGNTQAFDQLYRTSPRKVSSLAMRAPSNSWKSMRKSMSL
jgi:hypothetical protein